MGNLIYPVKDGDWNSVRTSIQKLSSRFLGTNSKPTFGGLSIDGKATVSTIVATSAILSNATIDTLVVTSATISSLVATSATVDDAAISIVAVGSATVSAMSLTSGTFTSYSAISATISAVTANSIDTGTLSFTSASGDDASISAVAFGSATVSTMSLSSGTLTSYSAISATVSALVANTANISAVAAASVIVTSLVAISATISSLVVSSINATVAIPITLQMYDAEPARGSETSWNGGFQSLITSQALNTTGPADITVSKGTGKLIAVINAGTDVSGTINVYGDTVDRNTGAVTSADTDALTVDTLSTNSSTTDANSNIVHMYEDTYITSKWFTGTVVLSTPDLTLTDVDVYHCSFEQMNDKPSLVINTFDANLYTTNANAEFDAYLYTLHVTGDKCNIHNEGNLHIGAGGMVAIANKYWRLRQGNLAEALDGTSDGLWVDVHYSNSPAYVEDVTIKIWLTQTTELTLS